MGPKLVAIVAVVGLAAGSTARAQQVHAPGHVHRAAGGLIHRIFHSEGGFVLPPGPPPGWGFAGSSPDGSGWVDDGRMLPLGGDREPSYFFRREYAVPIHEMVFPTYYNPYLTRGQRYLPYVGMGGDHPAGGAPTGSSILPRTTADTGLAPAPSVEPPIQFNGRREGPLPSEGEGRPASSRR